MNFSYSSQTYGASYNDSFKEVNDSDYSVWGAGFDLKVPMGNGAARARLKRAMLQRLSDRESMNQKQRKVMKEVYDAIDNLNQNWQRILASRQEIFLSKQIYTAEEKQFQRGIRTSTEVLDAAMLMANAQIREVRAMSDFEISKVELAYSTGTQLGYTHVHLDGRQK